MTEDQINTRALAWLKDGKCGHFSCERIRAGERAETVTRVAAHGTDWAGDTDGGFYTENSIEIAWKDVQGRTHYCGVQGDEFESFWQWMLA